MLDKAAPLLTLAATLVSAVPAGETAVASKPKIDKNCGKYEILFT